MNNKKVVFFIQEYEAHLNANYENENAVADIVFNSVQTKHFEMGETF